MPCCYQNFFVGQTNTQTSNKTIAPNAQLYLSSDSISIAWQTPRIEFDLEIYRLILLFVCYMRIPHPRLTPQVYYKSAHRGTYTRINSIITTHHKVALPIEVAASVATRRTIHQSLLRDGYHQPARHVLHFGSTMRFGSSVVSIVDPPPLSNSPHSCKNRFFICFD